MLWFCGTRSLEISARCRIIDEAVEESQIEFKVFCNGRRPGVKIRLRIGTGIFVDLSQWVSTEEGQEVPLSQPLIYKENTCGTNLLLCKGGIDGGESARDQFIRITSCSALEPSISECVKGIIPFSLKRKHSVWGARNKSDHPLKVINLEDSEDFKESSCHRLSFSEPLQQTWQQIDVVSRDALMKLQTQVLFASIDQRSEQAGGSSACSALVIVIADWLQANKRSLPDQCEFDDLIKE